MSRNDRESPTSMIIAFVFVLLCLTICTIFGNVLVIRAVCKFSSLRTAANTILVSLSVADLLMVTVFISRVVVMNLGPTNSAHHLCGVTSMINLTLTAIIILHLALLSVERFTAIKFPLRYRSLVTHRRTLIASGTVWSWGVGVSIIPPLLIFGDEETHVQIMEALTPCLHNSSRDNPAILRSNNVRAYLSFLLLALLVLPLATVIASYSYIIKVAYIQQKQIMNEESSSQAGQVTMKREMKAARTVAIVVGLCLASYSPLVVMLSIRVAPINPKTATPEKMYFTYLVASLNAVWNPVVYGWRNGNFRSSFKRLLKFGE